MLHKHLQLQPSSHGTKTRQPGGKLYCRFIMEDHKCLTAHCFREKLPQNRAGTPSSCFLAHWAKREKRKENDCFCLFPGSCWLYRSGIFPLQFSPTLVVNPCLCGSLEGDASLKRVCLVEVYTITSHRLIKKTFLHSSGVLRSTL